METIVPLWLFFVGVVLALWAGLELGRDSQKRKESYRNLELCRENLCLRTRVDELLTKIRRLTIFTCSERCILAPGHHGPHEYFDIWKQNA